MGRQVFQPMPTPSGPSPFHLDLESVLGAPAVKSIEDSGSIILHAAGDTGGVKFPIPQQHVSDAMEADFAANSKPAFFYILGDVVYFYGEATNYVSQFYDPYLHYPAPIFAIPGNHDGDVATPGTSSLSAFAENFCSAQPQVSQEAGESPRLTMIQPNAFWTLDAPFVTMIGLYTNVPEGGVIKQDQVDWLVNELRSAPAEKAVVVSLHHPPFSADAHKAGSLSMVQALDGAFQASGRTADLVLAGHVHNYQRFTRDIGGSQVPYIVAGAGGYWHLHTMQKQPDGTNLAVPFDMPEQGLRLENYCDTMHGYLILNVSNGSIQGEYHAVPSTAQPTPVPARRIDTFLIDTKQHKLTESTVVPEGH